MGKGFAPAGRKSWKFWQFFTFFGLETPKYSLISVKFGTAKGTSSAVRNFTLIRESCCPCGAKNLKIACWVNAIPLVARPVKSLKTGTESHSVGHLFAIFVHYVCIFTALHGMQSRYSDGNSVCPSVRPSVRPSVCLSNACIVTKRKKTQSIFLYHAIDNLV